MSWKGLAGIFFAPLIHLDFDHLFNNTTSFIVIGFGLFYLYKRAAIFIFFFIYFLSGLWGWFFAREGYHIGASGLIYGMFFFLITSAFLKKERKLIAFSLIIIFLYGAIVWGFFPIFPGKYFLGNSYNRGVAGAIAAFFKNEGPKNTILLLTKKMRKEENEDEDAYWKLPNQTKILIKIMKRLFIAIRSLTMNLLTALSDLRSVSNKLDKINWIRPDNLHITLKFLGETKPELIPSIENKIVGLISDISPFTITLNRIGAFGSRYQPRIIWIGSKDTIKEIDYLHKGLEKQMQTLGYKHSFGNLVPHATIARI